MKSSYEEKPLYILKFLIFTCGKSTQGFKYIFIFAQIFFAEIQINDVTSFVSAERDRTPEFQSNMSNFTAISGPHFGKSKEQSRKMFKVLVISSFLNKMASRSRVR